MLYYGLGWACEVDRDGGNGALRCQVASLGDSLAMTERCGVRVMGRMEEGRTRKIPRHMALRNGKKALGVAEG